MLTKDLLRVRVRKDEIVPSFVGSDAAGVREDAEALLDAFRQGVEEGWTRGRLDEEVADQVADRRDHKLVRGLAKVLFDRSEFETASPVDPAALRDAVFRAARAKGPLAAEHGALGRPVADDVLAEVGATWGLDAAATGRALYADLREEQRIVSCAAPDADWLLRRYDVALVQAVLMQATGVRVRLSEPSVPRLRQLLRHLKFHELIAVVRREGPTVELQIDGPASLLRLSTRYGAELAAFFPAVLLQEGPWTFEATLEWTKAGHRKRLVVTSRDGLVSHYADVGAYETRTQRTFAERFRALESGWTLDDETLPIDLGGRALLMPDFRLTKDGRTAYLEIVGFWRKEWLERRLKWLSEYAPGNLVLAVSRKLKASPEDLDLSGAVVEFSEVVPPRSVLEAIERIATRERAARS